MQRWTAEEKMPALNNGLLSLRPSASSLPVAITTNLAEPAADAIPPVGNFPGILADLRPPPRNQRSQPGAKIVFLASCSRSRESH